MDNLSLQPVIYPRLLRRVQAALVDGVALIALAVLWWASLGLLEDLHPAARIAPFVIGFVLLEAGLVTTTGGTIGHHVLGLKVRGLHRDVRLDPLSAFLRALVRNLFGWLSFMFVLTTRKRQALHDYMARSIVVYRNPESVPALERRGETELAPSGFVLPSAGRRMVFILGYVVLGFVLFAVVSAVVMSEECAVGYCSRLERVLMDLASLLWLFSVAAIIVLGWRGRLPGCRYRAAASKIDA